MLGMNSGRTRLRVREIVPDVAERKHGNKHEQSEIDWESPADAATEGWEALPLLTLEIMWNLIGP